MAGGLHPRTWQGSLRKPTGCLPSSVRALGEVPRIFLLSTRVNKGRRRGSAGASQEPPLSLTSSSRTLSLSLAYLPLYTTTSPAVTWGGFGLKEPRSSATNSPARKVDCSSASLCSKTLVETITPSPASTQ